MCSGTLIARDEIELREWIRDSRDAGAEPLESDAFIATLVRQVAKGERLEPWFRYERTWYAIEETIQEGVRRVQGEEVQPDVVLDAIDRRFWKTLLSPSGRVSARARLKAFAALSDAGAFPACTCRQDTGHLPEQRSDAFRAHVIRSVGQRHYRAALVIAHVPETYCAIRDAIEAKVVAEAQAESVEDTEAGEGDPG